MAFLIIVFFQRSVNVNRSVVACHVTETAREAESEKCGRGNQFTTLSYSL
jgi:hypothetical protein